MSEDGLRDLIEAEKVARAEFLRVGEGWVPTSNEGKRVRDKLRASRKSLKDAAKAENAVAAYDKVGYTPSYAQRGRKPRAT